MKKTIIIILIGILSSCSFSNKETCKKGLPEKHYDFLEDIIRQPNFNFLEAIVDFRQFGSYSKNQWIRKPENLKLTYSSLKQIGIKNFISEQEFNKQLFTDHWAETCWGNKSLNQILQNLLKSYSDSTGFDRYYIEFWERRKSDKNEIIVYEIFNDINKTYNSESDFDKIVWESEPTITGLLGYEIKLKQSDSLNHKLTNINYFEYLKSIGLYSSANNLIRYENEILFSKTQKFDKDYLELINQIETDSVNCENYWNWRHSAEWFTEIYDYGP